MTRKNDKLMQGWYERYQHSNMYTLDDCYVSASYNKVKAYYNCLNLMCKLNGKHGRIVSFTNHIFTFGFMAELNGKMCYIHCTRDNTYYMEV
jgi:hypothetical protein